MGLNAPFMLHPAIEPDILLFRFRTGWFSAVDSRLEP